MQALETCGQGSRWLLAFSLGFPQFLLARNLVRYSRYSIPAARGSLCNVDRRSQSQCNGIGHAWTCEDLNLIVT